MNIIGSIISKILHKTPPPAAQASQASPQATPMAPSSIAATPTQQASGARQNVNVSEILTNMARQNDQQLNWQTSIVDLMKLLGLDSSLQARKELAQELHYNGNMNDSAAMNIWLHRAVMEKLAENGGIVPEELKH